jgi:hypothetical protein
MPDSATRIVGPVVYTIGAFALESLEAINHQLKDGVVTLQLSAIQPSKPRDLAFIVACLLVLLGLLMFGSVILNAGSLS